MARNSPTADTAATSAQNLSNQYAGNASNLYSTLTPQLEAEAAAPAGYNPADLADMNTAAQQSAGGSAAGAVGQGGLLAARTRNAGAPGAAIAESARDAGQQLSKNALGIRTANAQLKERQRQSGLGGLESLESGQAGAGIGALGQVAPNVNASTNAENASWDWAKDILDPALEAASKSKNF